MKFGVSFDDVCDEILKLKLQLEGEDPTNHTNFIEGVINGLMWVVGGPTMFEMYVAIKEVERMVKENDDIK